MKQKFEFLVGIVVLTLMGMVLWKVANFDATSEPSNGTTVPVPAVPPGSEPTTPLPSEPISCPADAKQCPDGSYVGRVSPNCEFAACPVTVEDDDPITCLPDSRDADVCAEIYAPVCGLVQVQCITTPCDPVLETFGNSCSACSNANVISYTDGACQESEQI